MTGNACPKYGRAVMTLLLALLAGCWEYASEEAGARLARAPRPVSMIVYPVRVVAGPAVHHDARLSARMAADLANDGLARAIPSSAAADFPVRWHSNQALMAKEGAEAFALRVKEGGIPAEYALLVEVFCNPDESRVLGVHFYVAERSGAIAHGAIANSHWPVFKEVAPTDRAGGHEVAIRMLRQYLSPRPPA